MRTKTVIAMISSRPEQSNLHPTGCSAEARSGYYELTTTASGLNRSPSRNQMIFNSETFSRFEPCKLHHVTPSCLACRAHSPLERTCPGDRGLNRISSFPYLLCSHKGLIYPGPYFTIYAVDFALSSGTRDPDLRETVLRGMLPNHPASPSGPTAPPIVAGFTTPTGLW